MKTKKEHKQYVVAKVNPWENSTAIPGTGRSKIELLDIDNDFKWCYTWVSENNFNYEQWDKLYQEDYEQNAFVIEGFFANKDRTKDLVNADAKFQIKERADRQQLLYLIAQKLELI